MEIKQIFHAQKTLIRNILIKDHFSGRENDNYVHSKFTYPSTWTPKLSKASEETKKTINEIVKSTSNLLKTRRRISPRYIATGDDHNLTKDQMTALRLLTARDDIIIRPADKGSSVCIMDPDLYHNEIMRQLNDNTYYHRIGGTLRHNNVTNINAIIDTLLIDGFITERQCEYLRASSLDRDRSFYILPKIHKPHTEWPHPQMPAGRPIMADVDTESSRISEYIDSFLQPLACQHPSYIKDTYDFLSHIGDKQVDSDCYLVTGDVTSLYTNMYTDTAIDKLKEIMRLKPDRDRPDGQLIDLLKIICNNNDFKYNNDYYQQHRGFAMGKRFSPSMANIYMIDLDTQAIKYMYHPHFTDFYKRFLDDKFFVRKGDLSSLKQFEKFLNQIEPGIQIKLKWHSQIIDFLDITIFKGQRQCQQYYTKY